MNESSDINPYKPGQAATQQRTNGLALSGFILGILSVTIGCLCFPPLFSIPGLICSIIGRKEARKKGEGGDGLALAGIILSSISLVLVALGIIAYVILIIFGIASGSLQDFQ